MTVNEQTLRLLADAAAKDDLVLFAGAGLSFQARCESDPNERMPLWRDLAKKVGAKFHFRVSEPADEAFDVFDAVIKQVGRAKVEEYIQEILDDSRYELSELHYEIKKIKWNSVITTNYDGFLSRLFDRNCVYNDDEFIVAKNKRSSYIFHLHGVLRRLHTLTRSDFKLWKNNGNMISFLEEIFRNKTVLFIGYSYSDPHINEVLSVVQERLGSFTNPHYGFMWNPTEIQIKRFAGENIHISSITSDEEWLEAFRGIVSVLSPPKKTSHFVSINGLKLYSCRNKKGVTIEDLAADVGCSVDEIRKYEYVNITKIKSSAPKKSGRSIFQQCEQTILERIEKRLGCAGYLSAGKDDDLSGDLIAFYRSGSSRPPSTKNPQGALDLPEPYKVLILDYDGTLTHPEVGRTTWEMIWLKLGYTLEDCARLHAQFRQKEIDHQEWCNKTKIAFCERGFTQQTLKEISQEIRLMDGIQEAVSMLHQAGIKVGILSGSIEDVIRYSLGEIAGMFFDISGNRMNFDMQGRLSAIVGTKFDYEGKGKYLEDIIKKMNIRPQDVLYVGNSFNDHWAVKAGVRTLCINAGQTDPFNTKIWHKYRPDVRDLREILRYIALPGGASS